MLSNDEWVSQSLALVDLARETGSSLSSSPAQLVSNLLKTIGLCDVELWERQAKVIIALSPGETVGASDLQIQQRMVSLLDAVDSGMLGDILQAQQLKKPSGQQAAKSGSVPKAAPEMISLAYLWLFVGSHCRSSSVLTPVALDFFRLLAPSLAETVLHRTPASTAWVSSTLLKLATAADPSVPLKQCSLIQNVLIQGAKQVCAYDTDQGFLQHFELVHGIAVALGCEDAGPTTFLEIKQGSLVYYAVSGVWVEHTVVCVEESDVEKVYTLVNGQGDERQTVASRVFLEKPSEAQPEDSDAGLFELLSAEEKKLRDVVGRQKTNLSAAADGTALEGVPDDDVGVRISCVRLLLKCVRGGPHLSPFIADSHSWWTTTLIDAIEDDSSSGRIVATASLGMLTVCLGTTDVSVDVGPSARLFPKVVSAFPSSTQDGMSEAIVNWVSAIISKCGMSGEDARLLWCENARHFSNTLEKVELRRIDADVRCVSMLLKNSLVAEEDAAGALFAVQLLVPTFLAALSSGSGQQRLTFATHLQDNELALSMESLLMATKGAADTKSADTVLAAIGPHLARLYGAVNNPLPPAQTCAFSVLRLLPKKFCSPPSQIPQPPPPPLNPNAAEEKSSEGALHGAAELSASVVEQFVIPKGLLDLLDSNSDLKLPEGSEDLDGLDASALLGILLPLLLLLDIVEAHSSDKAMFALLGDWAKGKAFVPRALAVSSLLYQEFSDSSAASRQRLAAGKQLFTESLDSVSEFFVDPAKQGPSLHFLAGHALFRCVCVLPSMVRSWWSSECPRALQPVVQAFVETEIGGLIAKREVGAVLRSSHDLLTVQASSVSREISAAYVKDDCSLEVVIRLPLAFPLKNVEVECRKRLGVTDQRWRRWVLQIVSLLATQDGSVLDAIVMWKNNVDKEFEGLEPCPICYSILHPKSLALPTLKCGTCSAAFHQPCLFKWFNTSHKSKCPHCQQPFSI